jgi:hypothetical protein
LALNFFLGPLVYPLTARRGLLNRHRRSAPRGDRQRLRGVSSLNAPRTHVAQWRMWL